MTYLIEQISNGTYSVAPQLVAEAVLRRWRAELSAFNPRGHGVDARGLDDLQSPLS